METRGRKKVVGEPTPPAHGPRDVETIERLQQQIQELELQQLRPNSPAEEAKETKSEPIMWDIGDEEEEYPFVNKYPKEEGFAGKGGFGGEEDNIEDVVVVANDLCSSMIQTILSVDFEEDINTKSHELMSFGKNDQGSRSSRYKEREFDARDANLDATSTRDE
ncbi:hypothetical protein Tco_0802915 [Tanacetum coccineum]|uniref:Uncharacterized protein n=1 Tax=Tanacetum coccineum TaxID=301880 RepID=A0ABQ5A3R5_9ASTR